MLTIKYNGIAHILNALIWWSVDQSVMNKKWAQVSNYYNDILITHTRSIKDPEEVVMDKVIQMQKCVICEKSFSGFGNNPEPVEYGGRCCDDCNAGVVIPRRILDYDWDR